MHLGVLDFAVGLLTLSATGSPDSLPRGSTYH
jgi:hypothetical protein